MFYGHADFTDDDWIDDVADSPGWNANANTSSEMPIHAMSGILQAPQPEDVIPKPATVAMLGLAACGLGGYVRRRCKA